jgi:replicative DNA helicase
VELNIDIADRLLYGVDARVDAPPRVRLTIAAARAARGVAAAVLAHPPTLDAECRSVEPDDLRDALARDVFVAVRTLYLHAPGRAVDGGDVFQLVADTRRWDRKSLTRDLVALHEQGGAGVDAGYYVRAVGITGRALSLLAAADVIESDVLNACATDEIDPSALTGIATDELDRATADRSANDPVTIHAAVSEAVAEFKARHDGTAPRPLVTGFADIDKLVPGLRPGQLTLVAARPSVGKTALGLAFAVNAARDHARCASVYFASLEMSRRDIGERVAFMTCGANGIGPRLRAGEGTADDLAVIGRAARVVDGLPLWVDDTPSQRVGQIASAARRVRRRNGLSLILVDYLQLVAPDSRRTDRREQVEDISRGLKRIAREMSVPVVAMAQLNREVEGRSDQKPKLSDLREAGGLEQDADVVMLLWRHAGQPDTAPGFRIGCLVAKHRNGPTGEVSLTYVRASMRFENYAPEPQHTRW